MKTYLQVAGALFAVLSSTASLAQAVDAPSIMAGDKWLYTVTIDEVKGGALSASTRRYEVWVTRVGSHSFVMAHKPADSNLPAQEANLNLDWSTSLVVNGDDTVVTRPYAFPLVAGKSWETDMTKPHPAPGVKTLRNKLRYTVLGWEKITVPAGTFNALKIETEGNWFKVFEPQGPSASSAIRTVANGQAAVVNSQGAYTPDPIGGRMYKLTWYAPEIKRDVKMISEDYDAGGSVQHRSTEELESFTAK